MDELNASESGKNKKVKSNPWSGTVDNEQNKLGGDDDASDICNNGVELLCEGSDLDEFPDSADNTEPGEISNDEPEPETSTQGSVRSKVVQVNKTTTNTRSDKYAHLRHDPEFHQFLDEMLDVRMNRKCDYDSGDAAHH